MIDPIMHGGDDEFFSVIDTDYIAETKRPNRKQDRGKRIFNVMFYKEGEYALNFIRVKESMIPLIAKVDFKNSQLFKSQKNIIDNRFQITLKINSIEGKIEAF
ncbi:UNKNOWN [Stylonychia lemnae]|uniref:Uncharacterized protein n=1 Tax=Stylonychia lemnae TaxID=5949 RepID=A0A078B7V3_STYLE|nr:UNKNOWN [Stylonychia lemnae]|eukprot:CDW89367.1 UNKNOWN [Stylonychia lemnae]